MVLRALLLQLMVAGVFLAFQAAPAAAFVLVTEEESKLPKPPGVVANTMRGVTRSPRITLLTPVQGAAAVRSPLLLRIRFESFGGARIDPDSIRVTYLKVPAVDLTQRITPYLFNKGTGIEIPGAELPSGEHFFRVDVKDTDGRSGASVFSLTVAR